MLYARISDDTVAEIINLADDLRLEDAFHPDIAASLVECPEGVEQGWAYVAGAFTPVEVEETLATYKSMLKSAVDAAAEVERKRYITPGEGQAMTYQQKVAEAQAFKAASEPQLSDYPMLSSEVGITAETVEAVADVVLIAFAQWQQIGAMIESTRLGAKRDIDAAQDEAAAHDVFNAIAWPNIQVHQ